MTERGVTAVLMLSCKDQRGLVAAVAQFISGNGGNIVHADQHTDFEANVFIQRVEWELEGFQIRREDIAEAFRPIAERFGMRWRLLFSDYLPRMAVFVSRQGHCLLDLLALHRLRELRAEIAFVASNHRDLEAATRSFGVDFLHLPIEGGDKGTQEREALKHLTERRVDLIVLARYMQVLGRDFVVRYPNRIINIHHSFLPAFAGARPYHQAHARGVKVIGATAHYVTADLDQGPIIEQDVARISHRDTVGDLIRKGRDLEKMVLARAVDLELRNRVAVYGNKTVVFG